MPEKPPSKLGGRILSAAELQQIRRSIEELDSIAAISDEMRALVEAEWPDLVGKLPPKRGGAQT